MDVSPSMPELMPRHRFSSKGIDPPERRLILALKSRKTNDSPRIKISIGNVCLRWIDENPDILVSDFALLVGDCPSPPA
jgi:hypothetical protein